VSARLATFLGVAALALSAAPTAAPAAVRPVTAAGTVHTGVVRQARLGRGFGSRGYGRSPYSYRRTPYGYRRHGHPFLRGLFFGWLLSHFFGGGFPLFPFVLLGIVVLMLRRRRRPRYY
jgi:uncharacterized membrane protein